MSVHTTPSTRPAPVVTDNQPLVRHRFTRAALDMHEEHGLPLICACGTHLDAPTFVALAPRSSKPGTQTSVDCASCYVAGLLRDEWLPDFVRTADWHPEFDL